MGCVLKYTHHNLSRVFMQVHISYKKLKITQITDTSSYVEIITDLQILWTKAI